MTQEYLNISRALETNSFTTQSAGADEINPEIWLRKIEEFAKAKTVMEPLGRRYTELLGAAGDVLNLQFDDEITAAALTENVAITPEAFSYTQVQFTPTEYGLAVALTRKQRIRSINDIMEEKTRDMGYALAKLLDQNIFAELDGNVTNQVISNAGTIGSLAPGDEIDTDDIADAIGKIRSADYDPRYIVIHPAQEKDLMKLAQFVDASVYGGREVVMNGEIGRYLGLRVLVTTLVPATSGDANGKNAYVLDQDSFGIAWKMATRFDRDYKVLDREFLLAAVQEYDVQMIRIEKACRIVSYAVV